jgi:hypothetical protein
VSTKKPGLKGPGLFITPEQLAERDRWELAHKLGKCTLEEALTMVLHSGAPATPYLTECVERAFGNYSTGVFLHDGEKMPSDLAEPFGAIKSGNAAQAIRSRLADAQAFELVQELHTESGLSLTRLRSRTHKDGQTAFSRAADILKLPESTVATRYYRHQKSLPDGGEG